MNNVNWTGQSIRWIIILLFQVLICKRIEWQGGLQGAQIIVYPMLIMLLPMRIPTVLLLFLAFIAGIFVDMFYNSLGIHASAMVFMAYVRPLLLNIMQPREGYNLNHNPTKHHLGLQWFLQYAAILLLLFLLFYCSVQAFSFVYIGDILRRCLLSFLFSFPLIVAYQVIFNPK